MPGESGYAVGWGTLALINAGLAQGKSRSGLFWFLVSILLGPLATFLIVLLPLDPAAGFTVGKPKWTGATGTMLAVVVGLIIVAILGVTFFLGSTGNVVTESPRLP